ncbi:MAG: phosphate acetyltransferase [Kiritimatiellales bacterium]
MKRSAFIEAVIKTAQANPRTIVLPEGSDDRVVTAANQIMEEKISRIVIIGDDSLKTRLNPGVQVINPETSDRLNEYARTFYEMRKSKGITPEQAMQTVKTPNYFGMIMVYSGAAAGLVSGAVHSTADTVRPALQIIKGARKGGMVSSMFFMVCNGVPYVFSDCGLVENPTEDELAQIAVQSAQTAKQFNIPATVAMLSYSTKGSAKNPLVDKVVNATAKAKILIDTELAGQGIKLDGEFQLDAAIVPSVGQSKAPGSDVAGNARVLIFPDLNAGNIGYKLTQRLGGAEAYGPILQGLKKPVNDLSRGCSVEDIVGVAAITVVQSL